MKKNRDIMKCDVGLGQGVPVSGIWAVAPDTLQKILQLVEPVPPLSRDMVASLSESSRLL